MLILVSLVLQLVMMASGEMYLTGYTPAFYLVMFLNEVLTIVLPGAVLLMTRFGKPMRSSMRLRFRPIALMGLPIGIAAYFFVIGVTAVWTGSLQSLGLGMDSGIPIPTEADQLFGAVMIVAVVPALCEEFAYRGLILPAYERGLKSQLAAVMLTGAVFGLMHGIVTNAPGHVFLGVMITALVVLTDSIWMGVIAHFTNNVMSIVVAYLAQLVNGEVATVEATPIQMMGEGLLFLVIGIFGLIVVGAVFYMLLMRDKRDGLGFFAKRENARREGEVAQPILVPPAKGQGGFLAWLPLLIATPIILYLYANSFSLMVMTATWW
jgi:membrane protease YdiL (CAAX protease family)